MNNAPASMHTINASEACGRETSHNAACANMRAYRVARHYDALAARPTIDADDPSWARAHVAPNLRWHGTRNLEPRAFTDDAWRARVTAAHLKVLLARERECSEWGEADRSARRVAVHYRINNAPWV